MSANSKATKKQLLKMIDNLEKNPDDKIHILGDTGITLVGVGLGAAPTSLDLEEKCFSAQLDCQVGLLVLIGTPLPLEYRNNFHIMPAYDD